MDYIDEIYINDYDLHSYDDDEKDGKKGLKTAISDLYELREKRMDPADFSWSTYVDYQMKNNSSGDYEKLKKEGKNREKKYKKILSAANRSINNFSKIVTDKIPYYAEQRKMVSDIINLKIDNKEINKILKQINNELSKKIKKEEKEALREAKKSQKVVAKAVGCATYADYKEEAKAYYRFARDLYNKVSTFLYIPRPRIESLNDKEKNIEISDGYVKDVKEKIEARGEFEVNNIQEDSRKIREALNEISLSLSSVDDKNLENDIEKETPTISRIVSPKLVSVSKANYEKITKSKLSVVDIEMVQTIVNENNLGLWNDRKRIEKLEQALKEQINIELKKQRKFESVTNKAERIINFAKENTDGISRTVDDYIQNKKDISSRERKVDELEEKQMEITSEEEKLYASPQYVEKEYVAGGDVRVKHTEIDKSSDFSKLMQQQKEVSEKIDENKKEIEDRKNIRISLPEQYKNLKKKIKENSELKKAIDTINKEKERSL